MRHWQCVCALTISAALSGCATVTLPDIEPYFDAYALHQVGSLGVRSLSAEPEVRFEEAGAVLDDDAFRALEVFVESAYAQQRQLELANEEIEALQREVNFLILAGRFTEDHVQVAQKMYVNEARACQISRFAMYGLAGGLLVLLGVGL